MIQVRLSTTRLIHRRPAAPVHRHLGWTDGPRRFRHLSQKVGSLPGVQIPFLKQGRGICFVNGSAQKRVLGDLSQSQHTMKETELRVHTF